MALNSLAWYIICTNLGIEDSKIKELFLTFKNAKRRFETDVINGTTIIDDYAHHPTEIKVTLQAVRQKYPDKRLVVVFKPNTYSRTRDFKDEFVESLKVADKVFLTEIDCNREDPNDYPGVTSYMILNEIEDSELIDEGTISKLKDELHSVICFMGCAYVDGLIESLKIFIANTPKEES